MAGGENKIIPDLNSFFKFPWKEKELCDVIENKIDVFCNEVLWETYISHKREWQFWLNKFWPNKMSIDFKIETENGTILLEVKNPTSTGSEMSAAIGQSLVYKSYSGNRWFNIYRNLLLTTRVTKEVIDAIKAFFLPIELIVVQEDKTLTLTDAD